MLDVRCDPVGLRVWISRVDDLDRGHPDTVEKILKTTREQG